MKNKILNELNDEALESVSGGLTGEVSVCRKCGATGIVVSETQLCETCHHSEMYAKHKKLQVLWQTGNHVSGSGKQNTECLLNIARSQ